jgi:hypothetical protein
VNNQKAKTEIAAKLLDIMMSLSSMLERTLEAPGDPGAQPFNEPDVDAAAVAVPAWPRWSAAAIGCPSVESLIPRRLPDDAFTSTEFRSRWKPGRPRSAYVMSSPLAQSLGRIIAAPIFKQGSMSPGRRTALALVSHANHFSLSSV